MGSWPARRDELLDELCGPPTPRRLESGFPPQAPPSSRSGEHRRPSIDDLHAELNALLRPIAKARPEKLKREALNAPALERFRLGVDLLEAAGWSRSKLARRLGCAQTTLDDVYDGHRYVPSWMEDALPEVQVELTQKRVEQLKKAGV